MERFSHTHQSHDASNTVSRNKENLECFGSTVPRSKNPVKSTKEEEDNATKMEIKRLASKLKSLLKQMREEEEEAYAIRMIEKMEEESRKRWDNLHRSSVKMAMQQAQRYESSSDAMGKL